MPNLKAIYKPKGLAAEYAKLALNLYTGCAHGCAYCYAPKILHKSREDFAAVAPRNNVLEMLYNDLASGQVPPGDEILLCFTCDPYQSFDVIEQLTRQALEMIESFNRRATVLTKGGRRACRDFDILARAGWRLGVSLTTKEHLEPDAASMAERIESLRLAKVQGITTWVSAEPVHRVPEWLEIIAAEKLADEIHFGPLNYHEERLPTRERQILWRILDAESKRLGLNAKFKTSWEK